MLSLCFTPEVSVIVLYVFCFRSSETNGVAFGADGTL